MKELAIVVPTYNERLNIVPFLESAYAALAGIEYEVVFVDDNSPDGTAALVREIAQQDERVRVVQRVNRRGLASACVEGMLSTSTPFIAVMDGDLQHDERIIPEMLRRIKEGSLDVVVGSRNVSGGSMGEFSKERVALSMWGRRISSKICGCRIEDPMSGFFLLRRSYLMEVLPNISSIGFKILVDLLASARRPVRIAEVPYTFRNRQSGESKLDLLVGIEYLQLILDKSIGQYLPASFVLFALVGSLGVVLYSMVLYCQLFFLQTSFGKSQIIAAVVAMTFNFLLNNLITYRDRRLKGWKLFRGLLFFYLACSIGLFVNLRVAEVAHHDGTNWLFAGLLGLVVGSVWNYGVTQVLTWSVHRKTKIRAQPA